MQKYFHDTGLNDAWVAPAAVQSTGKDCFRITLREPLGRAWDRQIVSYALPGALLRRAIGVSCDGVAVPCQCVGDRLYLRVESLAAGETRVYDVAPSPVRSPVRCASVTLRTTREGMILSNGIVSVLLPANRSGRRLPAGAEVPGPVVSIRRGTGAWMGAGRIECRRRVMSIKTAAMASGPLWTAARIVYRFEGDHEYAVDVRLEPDAEMVEIREESTLPPDLAPQPRPYREIGSLGRSFWGQAADAIGEPCVRPCPTGNFIFDLRPGLKPDRMVTHSTASWEIMELPLGAKRLRTYTAMRQSLPFIDGAWMGVYARRGKTLLGVVGIDTCHWRLPDRALHPAHRTPGAHAEGILVDGKGEGTYLRLPIEGLSRRWLLAAVSLPEAAMPPKEPAPAGAVRHEPDPAHPLWQLRRSRGDLPLDKVKDWSVAETRPGAQHPRIYFSADDIPAIRRKVDAVPELRRAWRLTRGLHSADMHLLEGRGGGLAAIEKATRAGAIVEGILTAGYAGASYGIGLARPLRRYAVACDVEWDHLSEDERAAATRVCSLGAYILSDGDWWQYVTTPGETTYLPNFNTDVFCALGHVALLLPGHPCSDVWLRDCLNRLERDLEYHLRRDGGGEENVGGYLLSTWTQLHLPMLWAFRQCGIRDYSRDPRVIGGARFLLSVLGPADPRDKGTHSMPPIGHHPHARKSLTFASWLAAFLKESEPVLAEELMWAWRVSGARVHRNMDHSGPEANPFSRHFVFHDSTIAERQPVQVSRELPHVGAVLRSHAGSAAESYLFLKAGRIHSHHDEDEGSFHWFGRGVPLALDGLPLANGATRREHNAPTFDKPGQPTAHVTAFASTPEADYVRAHARPGGFCSDAMRGEGVHRSGFEREIVFMKARRPGGCEYLVVKDTLAGPDACEWNLDVLSRKPRRAGDGRLHFPGHPQFRMGLDVIFAEPTVPDMQIEKGWVSKDVAAGRIRNPPGGILLDWRIHEHWLVHAPAGPGTTFVVVLFPRRPGEAAPTVNYYAREETLFITHAEGRDTVFLRSNPCVEVAMGGCSFTGRAGVLCERRGNAGRPKAVRILSA